MNTFCKYVLLAAFLLLPYGGFNAQIVGGKTPQPGKALKWLGVAGKNNESLTYLPEGFQSLTDGNFVTGSNRATVDKKIIAFRYVNCVALIIEYYEGDAKGIQKSLVDRKKTPAEKASIVNGFDFVQYSGPLKNYFSKEQFFRFKDRLYVAKAIAKSADDQILKDFFSSVTLVNDKVVVFPNLEKETKSVTIKDITETVVPPSDDSSPLEVKDTDRAPIILYTQPPKFPRTQLRGSGGQIKLRLLLSASGTVDKVEVMGDPTSEFAKPAIEAAKKTRFIPGEKNGRSVSVYQMQEFSFSTF